jgi:D-alanyl-D-alanine carboxypeptidase
MLFSHRNAIIITSVVVSFLATIVVVHLKRVNEIPSNNLATFRYEPSVLNPDPEFFNSKSQEEKQSSDLKIVENKKNKLQNVDSDNVTARAYLVGDIQSGKILLGKNVDMVLPVASMSKLVTAFVATDELNLDKVIEITPEMTKVPPDSSNIKAGEKYTVKELLYPMLLNSSNIAAEALASSSDRAHFMDQMKSYAWEIGMPSSFFSDPSGVSAENTASAKDLFALSVYLYKFRPDILALTRNPSMLSAAVADRQTHNFSSTHPFVRDERFIGGKTGRTPQAGDTMLTILNIDNKPISFIVLGSKYDNRANDTRLLIEKISKK